MRAFPQTATAAISSALDTWPRRRWILIAAAFHIMVTLAMYWMAVAQWFPSLSLPDGRWQFLPDAGREGALALAQRIQHDGWPAVAAEYSHWYVGAAYKFYAVGVLLFGSSFYSTIPLTTSLYLLTLWSVYGLTASVWPASTAIRAAVLAGLWPSALLHFTQPAKDAPFIAGQMLFLYAVILCLKRDTGRRTLVLVVVLSVVGFVLASTVRPHVMAINLAAWTVAAALSVTSWFQVGRKAAFTAIAVVSLWCVFTTQVLAMMGVPPSRVANAVDLHLRRLLPTASVDGKAPEHRVAVDASIPTIATAESPRANVGVPATAAPPDVPLAQSRRQAPPETNSRSMSAPSPDPVLSPVTTHERVAQAAPSAAMVLVRDILVRSTAVLFNRRYEWAYLAPYASSNLDSEVTFNTPDDVMRYAPRAMQIGMFAPFPSMWIEQGQRTGRVGRAISGVETALTYLLFPLAFFGLWTQRRRHAAWAIMGFGLLGMFMLGLVVTNVGALYRMRYAYWFAMIPMAVGGACHLLHRRRTALSLPVSR